MLLMPLSAQEVVLEVFVSCVARKDLPIEDMHGPGAGERKGWE